MGCLEKLCLLVSIVAIPVFASVSVQGFVKSGDFPVDSAHVSLVVSGVSSFSDASGYFSLERNDETSKMEKLENGNLKVSFRQGILQVDVAAGVEDLQLHAFDFNGKLLFSDSRRLFAGTHSVDLNRLAKSQSRYLLQIQSNGRRAVMLAKSAEKTLDTLVVKKEGFIEKRLAVGLEEKGLTVELDTIPVASLMKRGAGSSRQTVAQGSAIVAFSYAFENCDSVRVEGLPQGIVAKTVASEKVVEFSGTVTGDAGIYDFRVTTVGGYGEAVKSGQFVVVEPERKLPWEIQADGYASLNGGTTGGSGGDTVRVSTYAYFKAAVQAKEAKIVLVEGTIRTTDGDGYGLKIASDKTIMGVDSGSTIYGGLSISGVRNVIVYNLNIRGTYPNPGPSDGIAVNGKSTNVFLSHLNIWDAEDGNLDITGQASYVTVSYVKFWYTQESHPHRLNSLIGSGASDHPEDFGYLKVTYHHCWFSTLVNERMPRVMYGNAHIYNNYYDASGNLYCIGVGSYASALIENNYFKNVNNPIHFMYNVYAYILQRGNQFDNTTGTRDGTSSGGILGERYITTDPYTLLKDPVTLDSVPYSYGLDAVQNVPATVKSLAGPHDWDSYF